MTAKWFSTTSELPPPQLLVHPPEIEPLGLESGSHPHARVLELLVGWIKQDLEQMVIAVDAAAVFRWAGARAVETRQTRPVIVVSERLHVNTIRAMAEWKRHAAGGGDSVTR